jgi:hypothetical protein
MHVDADEAKRMQSRASNMEATKLLISHNLSKSRSAESNDAGDEIAFVPDNTHTPHFCYMKLIGSIPNFSRQGGAKAFDSEKCELFLADVALYVEAYEIVNNRKKYLVFEDNFQSSVASMVRDIGGNSFERLRIVCTKFETEAGIAQHDMTGVRSSAYFREKGMNDNDAMACGFVLSFCTGSNVYQTVNRGASIIARHGNGEATALEQTDKFREASLIMYYLIKALANIDFYWGVAARAVTLDFKELEDYKPGNLVTWIQFSSSKKGYDPPPNFASRNTIFIIYSLTGRCIENFSNFAEEEEVLFPPHSTFLVNHVEKKLTGQNYIYMRQIELGLCKYSVMWVDDYIFFDWWENKEYMEKASTVGTEVNVHFIPKASTDSAVAFLRSDFGQRLKNKDTFRIVTDMTRDEEVPPDNAGARLLVAIRELGFNNQCLVFTMNETSAWEKVNSLIKPSQRQNIIVTTELSDLENFINFVR